MRKLLAVLVITMISIGLYFTPHLAVNGYMDAAKEGDAVRLAKYIDFPALKVNLKAQLNAHLLNAPGADPAAIVLASPIVDKLVDIFVSPESLALMMNGSPRPTAQDIETAMTYESLNQFVLTVKGKAADAKPVTFVFNRDGISAWKMTAIRLPA